MGHRGLRGSCGLPIWREHELLVLWTTGGSEQNLTILKDGISMRLSRHVGHVLEDHLLVTRRLLAGHLTWSRQVLSVLASHAGVYDLSLLAASCRHLARHAWCHGVGQHEGWLRLLARLPTAHLKLATAGDGIARLACGGFPAPRRL